MANTRTRNTKVHSSSDVNTHSNLPVKLESMTMSYGAKRMESGISVICGVKDRFAKVTTTTNAIELKLILKFLYHSQIPVAPAMAFKYREAMNKDPKFSSVAHGPVTF